MLSALRQRSFLLEPDTSGSFSKRSRTILQIWSSGTPRRRRRSRRSRFIRLYSPHYVRSLSVCNHHRPSNLEVVDEATLRAQPIVAIDRSDPQSRSTGRSTPPISLRRYFFTATKSVSFVSKSNTIFLSVVSRAAELVIPSALVSITPGKFPTMTR
jgi:hypothetical protein